MQPDLVLHTALSIVVLLFLATGVVFGLKRSKFPTEVALVLVGIFVGLAVERFSIFSFLEDFRLSPELVFYIFLPTLIFESAFRMNFKHFKQNAHFIFGLSTLGLLISMGLIAWGMQFFLGFPWSVALLFGALISATDPVSILALFKRIGAPKKLSTIVEGESLFNDGMALVTFGLILEGGRGLLSSFASFTWVVFMGIGVGALMGVLFSKALDYVKDSKEIEISLTLILAHSTFILAEYFLDASGILATVAAGMVIGNYGAYKISPNVKGIMAHFWDYSAFLANSLLFLMVGIIIASNNEAIAPLLIPLSIVIALVLVSRMVMVYTLVPLLNWSARSKRIPLSWMHVLQWGGLRGALAIALILTLPESFPFYHELLIFTVGVISFTIIVNGLTIQPLLSLLGLQSFSIVDRFQHDEQQMLIHQKVNEKLLQMRQKNFISKSTYEAMRDLYESYCEQCDRHVHVLFEENREALSHDELAMVLKRHLLGIEKQTYTKLYAQAEISQEVLNILLTNIERQLDAPTLDEVVRLGRLTLLDPSGPLASFLKRMGFSNLKTQLKKRVIQLRYQMYRARLIGAAEALVAIEAVHKTNVFLDESVLKEFESRYKLWQDNARRKLDKLEKKYPKICASIQIFLAQQAAFHVEKKMLEKMRETGITNTKIYNEMRLDLERRERESESIH